jgi:tetratricopeptide (TPR) repeat protein
MGELSARKNRPDTALVYFDRAYALAPGDVKTIAGLSDVLLNKKNFMRTDSILTIALEKDSFNSTLLRLRVRSAYLSQDYVHAIAPGERLLQMDDPGAQALEWLALSYYSLRQYPDCIRVCEQMLEMGFALEAVFYYESRALAKLKDYRQSDSLLRICLSISIAKTTEWYYDDLADNHESLKEYRAALAYYDTAFYLFRDPLALYTCGRICEVELHNAVLAKRYYRRYLALAKPVTAEEKKAYGYVRKRWGRE